MLRVINALKSPSGSFLAGSGMKRWGGRDDHHHVSAPLITSKLHEFNFSVSC